MNSVNSKEQFFFHIQFLWFHFCEKRYFECILVWNINLYSHFYYHVKFFYVIHIYFIHKCIIYRRDSVNEALVSMHPIIHAHSEGMSVILWQLECWQLYVKDLVMNWIWTHFFLLTRILLSMQNQTMEIICSDLFRYIYILVANIQIFECDSRYAHCATQRTYMYIRPAWFWPTYIVDWFNCRDFGKKIPRWTKIWKSGHF